MLRTFVVFFAFFVVSQSQAQQLSLGVFNSWIAIQQESHDVFETVSCVANTVNGVNRLEVYSLKSDAGNFTEPGVLVSVKDFAPTTVRGVLGDGSTKFNLLPVAGASENENNTLFLTVKSGDRKNALRFLKNADRIEVKLYSSQGVVVKTLAFGASGFSKSYEKLKSTCQFPEPLD